MKLQTTQGGQDSNLQPAVLETAALPIEPPPYEYAGRHRPGAPQSSRLIHLPVECEDESVAELELVILVAGRGEKLESDLAQVYKQGRVFFSLWVGDELGIVEQKSLESFVVAGLEPILFVYEEVKGVPSGVSIRNAREVLDRSTVFRREDHGPTFAGFSNLFRYTALRKFDGIWFDLDMFVLDSSRELPEYIFGSEALGRVNGAVLSYPKDSQLAVFLLEECQILSRKDYRWGELGPNLVSRGVHKFNLWREVSDTSLFYPIRYREIWKLFDPRSTKVVSRRVNNSFALHVWNEFLRHSPDGRAKKEAPPPNSFFASLIGNSTAELGAATIEANWARDQWKPKIDLFRNRVSRLLDRAIRSSLVRPLIHRIAFQLAQKSIS